MTDSLQRSSPVSASADDPVTILRGWAKAYRDSPEHRFPSDPDAEFFPVDLDLAATTIEDLREELESAKAQVHIALHSNGFQLLGHAQCSQQWPDIREIHDAIANNLVNELTYSSIRSAAIEVQERYTAALSGTTDRTHSFVDAGFDTCRFCGERKSHADHTPAVSDTSTSHEGGK